MSYYPHPVKAQSKNVTAQRAIGTDYVNETGRPIMVLLCVIHTVTVQNSFLLVQSWGGAGAWSGWYNTPAVGAEMYGMLTFLVPAGETYKVTEATLGGTNDIIRWTEVEL